MTLPEQSDRAVAQTREFLVRLASPYGEGAIKGIRREVRAEALRLLRHYPYVRTDEKRCVDDMSDAAASTPQGEAMNDIVTRLRDWRTVHLARLHLLMEEAADQIAILESKLSLRENLEQGLMDGVARLQAEVKRLRNGALEDRGTVSQHGDCPTPDNAANADNTPATHATPRVGSEQSECTLTRRAMSDEPAAWGVIRIGGGWVSILANEVQAETSRRSFDEMENWAHEVFPLYRRPQPTLTDAEREAVKRAIETLDGWQAKSGWHSAIDDDAATLRLLLERL